MDHSESRRHSNARFFLRLWEYFKAFFLSEVIHRVTQVLLKKMFRSNGKIVASIRNFSGRIDEIPQFNHADLYREYHYMACPTLAGIFNDFTKSQL
jgi:hypothetical protein